MNANLIIELAQLATILFLVWYTHRNYTRTLRQEKDRTAAQNRHLNTPHRLRPPNVNRPTPHR